MHQMKMNETAKNTKVAKKDTVLSGLLGALGVVGGSIC